MTGSQQRSALQRQIWQIANDVRGAVDGWDFKQYVLGTLFYRFISENFASYMENGDDSINYAELRGCPRSYYPGSNLCIIRLIIDIFTQASLLNVVRS